MKRGDKISEDNVETIRALRQQGFSFNEISKQVGVAKSTVMSYCRDIVPGGSENSGDSGEGTPGLPPASESKDRIKSSDEVAGETNELRLLELRAAKLKAKREIDRLEREELLREEEAAALVEERIARARYSSKPADNPEETARLRAALEEAESKRQEYERMRQAIQDERRQEQIDGLRQIIEVQSNQIQALADQVANPDRTGRTQYDFWSEGLSSILGEIRGAHADGLAFLSRKQVAKDFDPNRITVEEREVVGDRVAEAFEKFASQPEAPKRAGGDLQSGELPREVSNGPGIVVPEANPIIMSADVKLISCSRCGAQQEIDINALRLALKQDGQPREKAFVTCQNPECGVHIEVSDLIADLLKRTKKGKAVPPFVYE